MPEILELQARFLSGELPELPDGCVSREIGRSWKRLRSKNISQSRGFSRPADNAAPAMSEALVQSIRKIGPQLRSLAGNPDECICVLIDAAGTLAAFDGGEVITRRLAGSGWRSAMSFLEDHAGSNALDLCLRDRAPAQTGTSDHTVEALHDIVIFAHPLLAQNGEPLGGLGLLMQADGNPGDARSVIAISAMMLELMLQVDISNTNLERLFAEQKAIANAMKDGTMVVNRAGVIEYMNLPACRILKVDPEQSIGHRLADVLGFEPVIAPIFESGIGYSDEEVRIRNEFANLHLVDTAVPIKDGAGRVLSVVNTFREFGSVARVTQKFGGNQAHYSFDSIIGRSPALLQAVTTARKAAVGSSNVLINGESGTGKELFAQGIHLASARSGGPFVAVNCAALPRDLIEAELFGYMPGSFTGAHKSGRPGKFEIASGGTIFLDEISEMPMDVQAKLLRVLQEREVTRLGASDPLPVDVRVVAALNQNIRDLVAARLFREDLFYRLNVIEITVPALRDREGDIRLLMQHYLHHYAHLLKKPAKGFAERVLDRLEAYSWPGNVRELQNVVERMVNFSDDALIDSDVELAGEERDHGSAPAGNPARADSVLTLAELEHDAVRNALALARYNVTRAAELLGTTKPRLYRMIKRHGIRLERTGSQF
ncbi:sigma 54-interacting transcriptional regulator [Aquamicrobium lusatiense]|uniref:sigma-54 interaction domain-containing protein n=1 Tax=Aquamicrobium lusatiense TaxID=89772 RepID=UPI002455F541|nr:sigma 54-interacting transcriptional regulator [Aquamicrobium lusatiense]MDH4992496.1 sigma 54-interacting transcriptional regulator [Aquamicrobium lusatiense]